jgi:GNAT superfamily N-acetyltransferase
MSARLSGFEPGALGRVVEPHGTYYAKHWGFGVSFEAIVARGLADFLAAFDAARDGFWVARTGGDDDRISGSISVVGAPGPEPARLRWFILEEAAQGKGVGRTLMREAMAFCGRAGHRHVYLTTFAGLDAARRLYEDFGFRLTREAVDRGWGVTVTEQRFDWTAH